MYRELVASVVTEETRIALLEDKVLTELFIERQESKRIVGNIYKGRVVSIVPGMDAAFVDIGLEKNGFLYVSDVTDTLDDFEEVLASGDEPEPEEGRRRRRRDRTTSIQDVLKPRQDVMVQITKEPIGGKGTRLTNHISLPGRYLVLTPTGEHIGVSRKIEDEKERNRLKKTLARMRPPGMGFIVRTAGEEKGEEDFATDTKYLTDLWQKIRRRMESMPCPSVIHQEIGQVLRVVRDLFTDDVDKLIIDSEPDYHRVMNFLDSFAPHLKPKMELYRREKPLFENYALEKEIDKALQRKVPLKSGGYILVEPTETLVCIDVNSGRYTGDKKLEQTALNTNLEAAKEIARQIRLRDIGGIIIIDFIDMEKEKNRTKVINVLQEALKRDRSRTYVLEMTKLGLVQMTRKRVRHSLTKDLGKTCPYCDGTGWIKSVLTTSLQTLRKLDRACRKSSRRELIVRAHPDVIQRLQNEEVDSVEELEKKHGKTLTLEAQPGFHAEHVEILNAQTGRVLERL